MPGPSASYIAMPPFRSLVGISGSPSPFAGRCPSCLTSLDRPCNEGTKGTGDVQPSVVAALCPDHVAAGESEDWMIPGRTSTPVAPVLSVSGSGLKPSAARVAVVQFV
jgi:hypothetical protein